MRSCSAVGSAGILPQGGSDLAGHGYGGQPGKVVDRIDRTIADAVEALGQVTRWN